MASAPLFARPVPFPPSDSVLLGHGEGGLLQSELVDTLILPELRNPMLAPLDDAAILPVESGRVAFTTDSTVCSPLFFAGGDIGRVAVNGTINDLAVMGARPMALSLSLILEEGLPLGVLRRVLASAKAAAAKVGVPIVTGDTKVVERGSGHELWVNTSGVGAVPPGVVLGAGWLQPDDAIVASGPVGEHGITLLAEAEGLELEGLASDTAPLDELARVVLSACPETRAMRDPTRGGLAAALADTARRRELGIEIDEALVPVRPVVREAAERLGADPLSLACEGRLVAFVPDDRVDGVLAAMRMHPLGRDAVRIGKVTRHHPGTAVAVKRGRSRPLGGR